MKITSLCDFVKFKIKVLKLYAACLKTDSHKLRIRFSKWDASGVQHCVAHTSAVSTVTCEGGC